MAAIPNVEEIIYFINKTVLQKSSKDKKKFVNQKSSAESQNKKQQELLGEVIRVFKPKDHTEAAIWGNFNHWRSFNRSLERSVEVLGASQKSTVWVMLNFIYVPYFARQFGFWNYHEKVDEGMPGGKFWFLPDLDPEKGEIVLPVTSVFDWLMDLIGCKNIGQFAKCIADHSPDQEKHESLIKNISNAYVGKSEPDINTVYKISEALKKIDFLGVFPDIGVEDRAGVTNDELVGRIDDVAEFMRRKGLNADKLKHQIPPRPDEISKILEGKASKKDTISFIMHMHERYKKPDPDKVRTILQIARASQLGFSEVNKFFSKDKGHLFVVDLFINKSLQLANMFKEIYNLTVKSMSKTSNEKGELVDDKKERVLFREMLDGKYPAEYLTLFKCIDQRDEKVDMLCHLLTIVLSKESFANRSFFARSPIRVMADGQPRIHTTEGFLHKIFEKYLLDLQCPIAISNKMICDGARAVSDIYSEVGFDSIYALLSKNRYFEIYGEELCRLLYKNSASETEKLYVLNKFIYMKFWSNSKIKMTPEDDVNFMDLVLKKTYDCLSKEDDSRLRVLLSLNAAFFSLTVNNFEGAKEKFDEILGYSSFQVPGYYKGVAAFCALAVYSSGFFKSKGFNIESCKKYIIPVALYAEPFVVQTKLPDYCHGFIPENYDIDIAELSASAKEYFWEVLYKPCETKEYLSCSD